MREKRGCETTNLGVYNHQKSTPLKISLQKGVGNLHVEGHSERFAYVVVGARGSGGGGSDYKALVPFVRWDPRNPF